MATPTLGYPSKTAATIALKKQGLPLSEIAQRVGISTKNARDLLYQYSDRAGVHKARRQRTWEHMVRNVCIERDILDVLKPQADKRGIHVNELVRRLITAIADDGLVDSVLDDGGEA